MTSIDEIISVLDGQAHSNINNNLTIVQLHSKNKKVFTGHYNGIDLQGDRATMGSFQRIIYGLQKGQASHIFTMADNTGEEPENECYFLDQLPEFRLGNQDGIYKIGEEEITHMRILEPQEFKSFKIAGVSPKRLLGKTLRLTLAGEYLYTVGHIVAYENNFPQKEEYIPNSKFLPSFLISAQNKDIPSTPAFISSPTGDPDKWKLTIPNIYRFSTSQDPAKHQLATVEFRDDITITDIAIYDLD